LKKDEFTRLLEEIMEEPRLGGGVVLSKGFTEKRQQKREEGERGYGGGEELKLTSKRWGS